MYSREEETARFSVSGPELQRLNCSQFGVDAGRERVYFLGLHDFHLTNITATNNNLLIGCDANARHTIWGSSEINERAQNQQGHQQTRTAEADHAFSLPFKTVCHNKPRERQREFNPSSCY
ncbi:uncharacterized protein LOC119652236 isoform X1 [Hermetia illucens]|uniref:uncharacterized protein LOC119652236 isoform X1 n=1 Tax=Hermetia illucens TaxID=343691 RepID=UPI0018CC57D9|nr:uncharacterized protein LOC119652236 isoform X1 [Hermetia illucens]